MRRPSCPEYIPANRRPGGTGAFFLADGFTICVNASPSSKTASSLANNQNAGITRSKLGHSLLCEHRLAEAEKESRTGYEILSKQENPSEARLHDVSADLAEEYEALNQPEKATRLRAELAKQNERDVSLTSRK